MNENELLRAILGLCQQWVTNTSGSPPVNTVAPVLTSNGDINTVFPGDILSCTTGTWTNSPTGYIYDFKYNSGTIVQTGPSNTYTVLQSDIGHPIHCTVTASNGSGSGTADSNTSGNVFSLNTNPPAIDNPLPQVGETMYVSPGTWVGTPTLTYQWQATGVDIPGATSPSFLLTVAEEGDYIRCNVTANGVESILSNTTDGVVAAAASGPCVLKLYADNIAGVVTDPVATWPDKSGNANDATQGTPANQPVLAAGPSVRLAALFDGSSSTMATSSLPTNSTSFTYFLVLKTASLGVSDSLAFRNGHDPTGYGYFLTGGNRCSLFDGVAIQTDGGEDTSNFQLITVRRSGGTTVLRVNGVDQSITNSAAIPVAPTTEARLGSYGPSVDFWNGYMCWASLFGTDLTDGQMQACENFLLANFFLI